MNAPFATADRFQLSHRDFTALAEFISTRTGIRMPPAKKAMIEGRLRRRIRALGFPDVSAYCAYLFEAGGLDAETDAIIDAVTTNKTDFFREVEHFDFLARTALPRLAEAGVEDLKVWSAAASTGAEAYTLAMVLADFAAMRPRPVNFSILATDISREVLDTGATAIYPAAAVEPVPPALRGRYLLRSRDRAAAEVRIVPELRRHVTFARLNLIETGYRLPFDMHVAFCRNVLIYFDKPTQGKVLARIAESVVAGGYLFVGHSETLAGFSLPLRQIAPTVFQRL